MLWLLDKLVVPMVADGSVEASPIGVEENGADGTAVVTPPPVPPGDGVRVEGQGQQEGEKEDEDCGKFFTIFIGDDKTDEVREMSPFWWTGVLYILNLHFSLIVVTGCAMREESDRVDVDRYMPGISSRKNCRLEWSLTIKIMYGNGGRAIMLRYDFVVCVGTGFSSKFCVQSVDVLLRMCMCACVLVACSRCTTSPSLPL